MDAKQDEEFCGFLDVKTTGSRYIIQKVRKKALMPSKVWKRLWCSVKKLGAGFGVRVQFNSKLGYSRSALNHQGEKDNSVVIPPSAVVYRIRSKTKQFAFGVSSAKGRKPLLSLSANSEIETQRWMSNIRHLLKPRRHCCAEKSHNISIVDNAHSKAAGLIGLHGDLIANETGVFIKDIHTGETVETFEWKEFAQFHLTIAGRPEDVKRICVMHTTKEFRHGAGELYIFCLHANKLLQDLVTQGRGPKHRQRSLSLNDENLALIQRKEVSSPPSQQTCNSICIRDMEIDRTSIHTKSVENVYQLEPNRTYNNKQDLYSYIESNISIASGIYERIVDDTPSLKSKTIICNIYEDADKTHSNLQVKPPPLPPRQRQTLEHKEKIRVNAGHHRAELSDHERKLQKNAEVCAEENVPIDNSNYVPMSPQFKESFNVFKSDIENAREDDYMIMQ